MKRDKAESVTLAAIKTLMATTGQNEEGLILELSAFFISRESSEKEVSLNAPISVTKNNAGRYSKVPFIGDEKFYPCGAYMGKRDGVIIVMTSEHEGEIGLFEIPASDAEEFLDGYEDLLMKFVGTYGMEGDGLGAGDAIEDEAHSDAILQSRMSDQRFGSW